MRILAIVLVGGLVAAAFVVWCAARAAVAYTTDSSTVVSAARTADVRGVAIGVADEIVRRQIADIADAGLRATIQRELGAAVARSIDADWLYAAIGQGHAGLLEFVHHGSDSHVIDLSERKAALARELAALGERAGDEDALWRYEREVKRALRQIPDATTLSALILQSDAGWRLSRESARAQARRVLHIARVARWISLAALLVLLVLLVLLALGSTPRLLLSVGVVLALSAGAYVTAGYVARAAYHEASAATIEREKSALRRDPVAVIAADGGDRVARSLVSQVTHASDGLALALGLLGALMIPAGVIIRRRAPG